MALGKEKMLKILFSVSTFDKKARGQLPVIVAWTDVINNQMIQPDIMSICAIGKAGDQVPLHRTSTASSLFG